MVFIGVFVIITCPYTGRSWIYNYLCNQCLSPLTLWVRTLLRRGVLDTTLCDKVCQWLATGQWFSPVSSTNRTDRHDITEILLKVALNTITLSLTSFPIPKFEKKIKKNLLNLCIILHINIILEILEYLKNNDKNIWQNKFKSKRDCNMLLY